MGYSWTELNPVTTPANGSTDLIVWDPVRTRLVMFSGGAGVIAGPTSISEMETWNGTDWTILSPATMPPDTINFAMAYDIARDRIVLTCGRDNNTSATLATTWLFNGTTWSHPSPTHSPTGCQFAVAAYDEAHSEVVLFGGIDSGVRFDQTLTWNGTDWTLKSPAHAPSARAASVMCYDRANGNIVLFGGDDGSAQADTWIWNGTDWTDVTPATSPPATAIRYGMMAYTTTLGVVLVPIDTGPDTVSTWRWNGTVWTELTVAATATSIGAAAAVGFDETRGKLLLWNPAIQKTWTLDRSAPASIGHTFGLG